MVRDHLVRPAHSTDEKIKAPGVSPGSRCIRGSSSTRPPNHHSCDLSLSEPLRGPQAGRRPERSQLLTTGQTARRT